VTLARASVNPAVLPRSFRLRHLLGVGLAVLGALWVLPRARAAWQLHDTAALFADYGLCMAGPTGAVLLRDQPQEFWQLVRRRLVAASATEPVFANCADIALRLTGLHSFSEKHESPAKEFVEWGIPNRSVDLPQLSRSMPDLSVLAGTAWPFSRSGYALLVKPNLGAKEAVHPSSTPHPGTLQGLQLFGSTLRARRVTDRGWFVVTTHGRDTRAVRSRDGGRKWTPTSPWQSALQGTSDRCTSDGSERAFGLEFRGSDKIPTLVYFDHDLKIGQSTFGGPNHRIKNLGCDESAAVAITEVQNSEWILWLCPSEKDCRILAPPPDLNGIPADGIDVARLRGTTVIAVTQGSVVRVASTRDDGRSYTPFTVALDHDDSPLNSTSKYHPAQLLAVGGTLLITQEAVSGNSPTLALTSEDFGASWHDWIKSNPK